jgi:hypothetical protein
MCLAIRNVQTIMMIELVPAVPRGADVGVALQSEVVGAVIRAGKTGGPGSVWSLPVSSSKRDIVAP